VNFQPLSKRMAIVAVVGRDHSPSLATAIATTPLGSAATVWPGVCTTDRFLLALNAGCEGRPERGRASERDQWSTATAAAAAATINELIARRVVEGWL
jgi:hypothetical protein